MTDAQVTEAPRKRGRPKIVREPMREEQRIPIRADGRATVEGRNGQLLQRKRGGNVDRFNIPVSLIPDGWSYEWKNETVLGQPDVAHQIHMAENGWTPVPASRHPGLFMPDGEKGAIRRDGMLLMERPNELTEEARYEERVAANNQMQGQQAQLGLSMPVGFEGRAFDRGGKGGKAIPFNQGVRTAHGPESVERPRLQIES